MFSARQYRAFNSPARDEQIAALVLEGSSATRRAAWDVELTSRRSMGGGR